MGVGVTLGEWMYLLLGACLGVAVSFLLIGVAGELKKRTLPRPALSRQQER